MSNMKRAPLYIGVMSGTSMDGVDTALVQINSSKVELIAQDFFPITDALKQALLSISTGQPTTLVKIGELDQRLGHLYANAVNQLLKKSGTKPSDIVAIGNHGQTVFHQPNGDIPFTMQLGDANIIACNTGITTVADFRRKDIALGGQGAPLVPAFHQTIFPPTTSSVVVLNIGGIANISVMRPAFPTIGYDTGPGNMLMDAWIYQQLDKPYDKDAEYAKTGKVVPELLHQMSNEAYLLKPIPKSTGRELFNLEWLENKLSCVNQPISGEDVQATLAEFTAQTIVNEVKKYAQGNLPQLLVCGGGAKNPLIMKRISKLLLGWSVCSTDEKGISSDSMEAIAFAWLAQRRIHNLPSNLPEVTGAKRLASLGVIYPAEPEKY